jgi:hypothetical protein
MHIASWERERDDTEETSMLDLIFIAVTVAFFALSAAYVRACERL